MAKQIFVNLPVRDLNRSMQFFRALGYEFNPQFTNDKGACMVVEKDSIYVMLLTEEFFQTFTPKSIVDATKQAEVLIALPCESRAAVDETVKKAVDAGGSTYNKPQDHGFMYGHGFQDPDGHIWEVFWMDPQHVQK